MKQQVPNRLNIPSSNNVMRSKYLSAHLYSSSKTDGLNSITTYLGRCSVRWECTIRHSGHNTCNFPCSVHLAAQKKKIWKRILSNPHPMYSPLYPIPTTLSNINGIHAPLLLTNSWHTSFPCIISPPLSESMQQHMSYTAHSSFCATRHPSTFCLASFTGIHAWILVCIFNPQNKECSIWHIT